MLIAISCWIVLILTLMWLPIGGGGAGPLQYLDLVIHAGLFTGLGLLVRENASSSSSSRALRYWVAGAVAVMLLGEGGQYLIPARNVSALDLTANGFGILYGLWLWRPDREWEARLRAGTIVVGGLLGLGGMILIPPDRVLQLIFEGPNSLMIQWIWTGSTVLLLFPLVLGRTAMERLIPVILQVILAAAWWSGLPNLQTAVAGALSGVSWIAWPFWRRSRGQDLLGYGIGPLWGAWLITCLLPPGVWMEGWGSYLIGCFLFVPLLVEAVWQDQEGDRTSGAISCDHS